MIRLEFLNLTEEQAQHILDAAIEARAFTIGGGPASAVAAMSPGIPASNDPGTPPLLPAGEDKREPAPKGATHDIRGVPYNGDFHSPRFNSDGSWAKRRGHDKDAAAAFEAPYLAPKSAAPQAAPSTGATMGNIATGTASPAANAPTAGIGQPGNVSTASAYPSAPAAMTAPAAAPAPQAFQVPTVDTYRDLWVGLCRDQKVTGAHEDYIRRTYGGHPCAEEVMGDEAKRAAIFALFVGWQAGVPLQG